MTDSLTLKIWEMFFFFINSMILIIWCKACAFETRQTIKKSTLKISLCRLAKVSVWLLCFTPEAWVSASWSSPDWLIFDQILGTFEPHPHRVRNIFKQIVIM